MLLKPSRTPPKHRGTMKSPPYAQTGVKGQPEGCKLLRREATQRVLTHKLQLLAQNKRLHVTQNRPIQLHTRFGESQKDGL